MTIQWREGSGRYPLRSDGDLYWIERVASPERHWVAYFRAAIGHMTPCVKAPPRDSIEQAQADAEGHLAGLGSHE